MIIWSRFHCRMQEYLKAEKRMIDKGFQLASRGVLRRIYKSLSYLSAFIFVFGCAQLPVQVGVEANTGPSMVIKKLHKGIKVVFI